jgi:hypothetical protein
MGCCDRSWPQQMIEVVGGNRRQPDLLREQHSVRLDIRDVRRKAVAVDDLEWQIADMRIRWRRLVTKSWLASRWHYQRHGLVLHGRPSDEVWYFAYGSNMHEGTFVERRRIRPLDSRVGRLVGYRRNAGWKLSISVAERGGRGRQSVDSRRLCCQRQGDRWQSITPIHLAYSRKCASQWSSRTVDTFSGRREPCRMNLSVYCPTLSRAEAGLVSSGACDNGDLRPAIRPAELHERVSLQFRLTPVR